MTKTMELDEMYDFLNEVVGIDKDALDIAFGIKGYNKETACDILYYKTGYRSFEQYRDECVFEFDEEIY